MTQIFAGAYPMPTSPSRAGATVACVVAAALLPATTGAQVAIVAELSLSGTVEAAAAGRVSLRDGTGTRHELLVQESDARGVPLRDGRMLAFPAEVRVTGPLDVTRLAPGTMVRIAATLDGRGTAAGPVAEVVVVDRRAEAGVTWAAGPPTAGSQAACTVTAPVKLATKNRLVVELPAEQRLGGRAAIALPLTAATHAILESDELERIQPGATVVSLAAVRIETGDLVARSLVVENPAAAAAARRGDDALWEKHRGKSDEPRPAAAEVRSAHFAFLTDVSEREAAVILDKLERMVGCLERFLGRPARGVVQGFIVRDPAAFPPAALREPLGVEKIRRGEGVCFNASLGERREAVLYSCANHGVVQHECVHGVCHLTFGSTGPTWLAEGLAELGNYWRDDDPAVVIEPAVMAYLQATEPKRRLLEIAVPGRVDAGTWQDYAWRWALCHLLANNPNYAPRFRPLAIDLMEGKPGVSFESVYGAVARELSFEYDELLRTVGNGYRADLAAWPWAERGKFRPLDRGSLKCPPVKAARGWQASRLAVAQGMAYEVEVSGTWRTAPAAAAVGAAGAADGHGRLVGVVFRDFALGAEVPLEAGRPFVAPDSGDLYLRCRDDWTQLGDNSGQISVTFRRAGE
jgi:hypothetical protein